MHISLGIRTNSFPINRFLGARTRRTVVIPTQPASGQSRSTLTFATNPSRRGGEWVIRDQYSRRHPAWSPAAGFPRAYSKTNPPYILVFRIGNLFHVRYSTKRELSKNSKNLPTSILSEQKGIALTTPSLLRRFDIAAKTLLDSFRDQAEVLPKAIFNPKDIKDARKKVFAAIYQRQGQPAFRRALFKAYNARCAITRSRTKEVLEAAHITPYRGSKTNAVVNGLLLRADIHTLFDLGLISIEPKNRKVKVSEVLGKSIYAKLEGKKLAEPKAHSSKPSMAALEEHFSQFQP